VAALKEMASIERSERMTEKLEKQAIFFIFSERS
jgi:hypothetical protein